MQKTAFLPETKEYEVGWREDFNDPALSEKNSLPKNWQIKGKPGTSVSTFKIQKDEGTGLGVLKLNSDRSSGSLVTIAKDVDLAKTPILRWRWRVLTLPEGADGRDRSKDDQAIGIYVGDGSLLSNKSVSYRWDTVTPVGTEGNSVYGLGAVKVKWITLRNSSDVRKGEWLTESRNFLEDYTKAWGSVPKKIYLSVSTNSQYTSSVAEAELDWIEFTSIEVKK